MSNNSSKQSTEKTSKVAARQVPEEETVTQLHVGDELRLLDGNEINDEGNEILREFARIANSDDLISTQKTILSYEIGDAPLYRFLNSVLFLGEKIRSTDTATVDKAFEVLRITVVDEEKKCKDDKGRRNPGIKNIGVPKIPVADQKFFNRIRADSLFLFKTLINFYLPNAASMTRAQYYTVINWAFEKHEPNFVTWLAGQHEIDIKGEKVYKRGLKGAYLKIKETQISIDEDADIKADDEIEKAFENTNKVITAVVPDWIEECVYDLDEPFMMLGKIDGNEIRFVNYTTSSTSHIKSSIKATRGSMFPSDLNYRTGNPVLKMTDAIKNLIPFTAAPELIMWQDTNGGTYMMPLYDEWVNDDSPNQKMSDRSSHFAAVLDLFNAYGETKKASEDLLFPDALDAEYDNDADIFKVGFITNQIDKVRDFKGDVRESFRWVNDEQNVLEFMGAQWILSSTRRPKKQSDKDKELKRTRLPAIAPFGYKYLLGCKFIEDGKQKYGDVMSLDIDFSLARTVYKKWAELRKKAGLKEHPDYITICVKNGDVGIWYENVVSDGVTIYDNSNSLVKVGTVPDMMELKGQWRVPTYQLRRVWNLLTGPWELYVPHHLENIEYFTDAPLNFNTSLHIMEQEPEQPFGRMRNLCSSRDEIDDCRFELTIRNPETGEVSVEGGKLCFPLVLRCGALWLYLFNETRQ